MMTAVVGVTAPTRTTVMGDPAVMATSTMAAAVMDASMMASAVTAAVMATAVSSRRISARLKRQERRSHRRQSKGPDECSVKEFHDSIGFVSASAALSSRTDACP